MKLNCSEEDNSVNQADRQTISPYHSPWHKFVFPILGVSLLTKKITLGVKYKGIPLRGCSHLLYRAWHYKLTTNNNNNNKLCSESFRS